MDDQHHRHSDRGRDRDQRQPQASQPVVPTGSRQSAAAERPRLLIRGFGVRVSGGALVIKAPTWGFPPDQSFCVQYGMIGCSGCALQPLDGSGRGGTVRIRRHSDRRRYRRQGVIASEARRTRKSIGSGGRRRLDSITGKACRIMPSANSTEPAERSSCRDLSTPPKTDRTGVRRVGIQRQAFLSIFEFALSPRSIVVVVPLTSLALDESASQFNVRNEPRTCQVGVTECPVGQAT